MPLHLEKRSFPRSYHFLFLLDHLDGSDLIHHGGIIYIVNGLSPGRGGGMGCVPALQVI